jgi:four helix bundle suffix protein
MVRRRSIHRRSTVLNRETSRAFCENRSAEVVANIAICVIHHANYLLDRQIRQLELSFVKEGGLRAKEVHSGSSRFSGATSLSICILKLRRESTGISQ